MGCRGWADRVYARHGQPPALRVRPDSLVVDQRSGLRSRGHARHDLHAFHLATEQGRGSICRQVRAPRPVCPLPLPDAVRPRRSRAQLAPTTHVDASVAVTEYLAPHVPSVVLVPTAALPAESAKASAARFGATVISFADYVAGYVGTGA